MDCKDCPYHAIDGNPTCQDEREFSLCDVVYELETMGYTIIIRKADPTQLPRDNSLPTDTTTTKTSTSTPSTIGDREKTLAYQGPNPLPNISKQESDEMCKKQAALEKKSQEPVSKEEE